MGWMGDIHVTCAPCMYVLSKGWEWGKRRLRRFNIRSVKMCREMLATRKRVISLFHDDRFEYMYFDF
jgi:hypothetical protein